MCQYGAVQGMEDPAIISDSQITLTPEASSEDKYAVRHGVQGPGWVVSPFLISDRDPQVVLDLSNAAGESSYVKKLVLQPHTNVDTVQLIMTKVLDNGNEIQIQDTVQLDESGEINFQQALRVISLTIRITAVTDPGVEIEVKVAVYGCFVEQSE